MVSPLVIKYDYDHAPTIKAFAGCDDFIRGLMGPVGGGKSSGCVVEILRRSLAQKPGPDGIKRTRWVVIRNCFDDQTEVLTERRGWVLFVDLLPEDRIASLKGDNELTYETPLNYYAYPYAGEMICLSNEGTDLCVTPEHNLYAATTFGRTREELPYRHVKAQDIYGLTHYRMRRDAVWSEGVSGGSNDFYEFLGFWFAEGYAGIYPTYDEKERKVDHYRLVVTQKDGAEYVRDLLKRNQFEWGEAGSNATNFVLRQNDRVKALTRELVQYGKSTTKFLPHWIKNSGPENLRAFLNGYLKGDGHIRQGPRESTVAYTSSRQLADDVQEIALKAGYVVNITARAHRSREGSFQSTGPEYVMTFVTEKKYRPTTRSGWSKVGYDGMVYCVEVPSHTIYVRRNGKAVWCGQSYPELRDTTIKTFHQWLPPQYFGKWLAAEHRYIINAFDKTEIEVIFRALDRPDQVASLLSLEVTGGWVNEAKEIPWSVIEMLQTRVGRFPAQRDGGPTWAGLILDTNPPDVDSKWYKFFHDQQHPPGFASIFQQPSGLSPEAENLSNLPNGRGYYERLVSGKDDEWVKVYVRGQYGFVMDGKAVFPEYNDKIHCKDIDPVPGLPVYRGWDFGLTPACSFSQVLPDGRWLIFDEMVSDNMGVDRFSDEVLEHSSRSFRGNVRFEDVGDPAGQQRAQTDERTCFEILWAKDIQIEPGKQSLTIRLESMRKPLRTLTSNGEPQLVLHSRCKVLRKAFQGGYHFRRMQVSGERFTSEPNKNGFSHIMDGTEYVGTILFGGGLTEHEQEYDDWPEPEYIGPSGTTGYGN